MEEKYETLMDLGSWEFGITRLVRQRKSKELFAVKCIKRGEKIDGNLLREIINHRSLRHPNIIKFEEVLLTPTHLAIVMEYAAGEELLYPKVRGAGRLTEDGARLFFQQLISAVSYGHSLEIYHRNLKLEKTLVVESPAPHVKICAFGYPKSGWSHLHRTSRIPTPACLQPEVLSRMEYDMKIADVYVWSCGITLYAMLVGAYAFEYPDDWNNYDKIVERIMSARYSIPDYVSISADCEHLLSRIFVANPSMRITIPEIKKHPWFLKNYPKDLIEGEKNSFGNEYELPQQNVDEITKIIEEAKVPAVVVSNVDDDDLQRDLESEIHNDDNFAKGILFYTDRNYINKSLME